MGWHEPGETVLPSWVSFLDLALWVCVWLVISLGGLIALAMLTGPWTG